MEGGSNHGVGPTTWNNRPVRAASSRHFNFGPHHSGHLTGPVRRWEKRWVHVSPPLSSTNKTTTTTTATRSKPQHLSNLNKPPSKSPILLCKWTPLSPSPAVAGELPRRKFRYTPIAVVKEQKKVTAKRVADEDFAEKIQLSEEGPAMDNADNYGMLDINCDLPESPPQVTNKGHPLSHYSRRS
ncbi:hypothetical protein RND81_09G056100 [Saponaria officinalis]|uniref:Uncharacterized protein n=1 Tax=Saponaria officinalis TaxID=3572 RepID=A0AAW1IJ37_SAPOF